MRRIRVTRILPKPAPKYRRPAVSGLDNLLSAERAPPAVAIKELKRMGYVVEEWQHGDDWWVGYAVGRSCICTICVVTGKAIIEVCRHKDYSEISLPGGHRLDVQKCDFVKHPEGLRCILHDGHGGPHDVD